jgi:hypothetical protein
LNWKDDDKLPYDEQIIICKPVTKRIPKNNDDEFIIMGCDGIW